VLLDEAAHEGKRRLIAEGMSATSVGTRCDVSSGAVPPQEFLNERLANPKKGGKGTLRAESLITGAENLLSKVKRISFHALEHNALAAVQTIDNRSKYTHESVDE
jgi:hypothetical protein